jgi:hypothetical protein
VTEALLPVYLIHWDAPDWIASAAPTITAAGGDLVIVHQGGRRPRVDARIIDHPENGGYSAGANVALRDWWPTGAPWCVIGSHDLHVEPDTFTVMLEFAATLDRPGLIGPTLTGPNDAATTSGWLSGGCLLISRQCAAAVGLFDERFSSYCEDVDYSDRTAAAGFDVARCDTRAWTLGSRSPHAQRLIFTNQVLIERKRHGWPAGARRWVGHLKEAAYRASAHDLPRARDHLYAFAHGIRHLVSGNRRDVPLIEPNYDGWPE